MKDWVRILTNLAFTIAFIIFVLFGWSNKRKVEYREVMVTDTIMIRDTIRITSPSPTSEVVVRVDTVWLERVIDFASDINVGSKDSASIKDSVAVPIPITQIHYNDPVYDIWVSGYKPKLDSVSLYCERSAIYHTTTVYRPPKIVLSVGPYVGYGNKGWNYGVAVNLGVPINIIKQHTKKRVGTEVYK